MTGRPRLKHERIAATLAREIRAGALPRRLPGEKALAERFAVSRNTVRAALADLGEAGLIVTRSGKGSYVSYDGHGLDTRNGWAQALQDRGVETSTELVRCAELEDHALAARLGRGSAAFVAVDRVRRVASRPVSFERSRIPLTDATRAICRRGLTDDSLTRTLAAAGLVGAGGEQWVSARPLTAEEARVLGRDPHEVFLHSRRVTWGLDGGLVEHVDSVLDPARFQLHFTFPEA